LSKNNNHFIAVIGGAVSGSVAASSLTEKGYQVVVIEQNAKPFGKIEDGLPKWHKRQREQEYEKINNRLNNPNIFYVPKTKLGKDIDFDELVNELDFSAIILAIGASKDRPLMLDGLDNLEPNSFIYQNDFIHWFNHQDEISQKNNIEIKDGAVIIGGGLASIDVAKACQIDLFRQAIKNKLNKSLDIEEIETLGIPKVCEKLNISYADLKLQGCTIIYRRNAEDMPLADLPNNANQNAKDKIKNVRKKILNKAKDKFLFNFQSLASPSSLIINNNKLEGILINKTVLIEGQVKVLDETIELKTNQIISSIGSIPEPIKGIAMEGETFKVIDKSLGIYAEKEGVFLAGNVVTGKGNIRDSLKHAEKVADYVINSYLNPLDNQAGKQTADAVQSFLNKKESLNEQQFKKIIAKIHELQKKANYHNNYNEWIASSN
jgi:ferredoxin/flavodoxin---NADP+ reductase|tara:strand:- start:224 stop:1525 length:1302 start_codon:yes stop_codon:yes gene_type:complete